MRRLAVLVSATAAALTVTGTALPASALPAQVPCSTAALASSLASAQDGSEVSLAPTCTYLLTAPLPEVTASLVIDGNGATLQRQASAPPFTLLIESALNFTVNDLNFTDGDNAITQLGNGDLAVNGGTFTGNSGESGGAISSASDGQLPDLLALSVTGATINGNSAGDGGAIFYDSFAGGVVISGCRFAGNTASGDGGPSGRSTRPGTPGTRC